MIRFFDREDDVENYLQAVSEYVCPYCGARGTLARHGYIWGFAGLLFGIRGWRVFCDPDSKRGRGCGRTVTLRLSGTLPGRSLNSAALYLFLLGLIAGCSVRSAWHDAGTGMSERTGYRIFRRLKHRVHVIRSLIHDLSPPLSMNIVTMLTACGMDNNAETCAVNVVSIYQKTRQTAFL